MDLIHDLTNTNYLQNLPIAVGSQGGCKIAMTNGPPHL